jgi:hypothetical protein
MGIGESLEIHHFSCIHLVFRGLRKARCWSFASPNFKKLSPSKKGELRLFSHVSDDMRCAPEAVPLEEYPKPVKRPGENLYLFWAIEKLNWSSTFEAVGRRGVVLECRRTRDYLM